MAEDLAAADSIDTFTMSHVVTTTTAGPTPKAKNAPKLASARKRRSISQEERSQLVMHLAAGKTTAKRLLAGLVGLSSIIPIRPSEWRRARVKHGHLFVMCGKRSNGRAIARVRRVRLEDNNLIVAATRLIGRLRAELSPRDRGNAFTRGSRRR
ncbi:hypothetical protein ACTZWW_05020 [Salinarimonas sp. NSM]|uniref:hypothetical protein n=1 Tax=Salinarimonas sp. NSM TaxID=3458003 RepID=UPI0040353489